MKTCTRCKVEKPKTEFSKNAAAKDFLQSRCRECNSAHYFENKEAISARDAAYRAANKQKIIARNIAYYAANKEKMNVRFVAYYAENPDKFAAHNRNRKARKRNADGRHTGADVLSIFDNQRGLCAGCGVRLLKSGVNKYHVDHIVPLAKGGSNWPENLQCLCPGCNLSKGAKHPDDWAKQIGRLL